MANAKNILMVPIHLDALYVPGSGELSVIEPMADFTRLPYFDGKQDVNPDVANISEEIVSQPFQDRGFHLKSGVHLHWALPDALTKGSSQDSREGEAQFSFPIVPNRWLVIRTNNNDEIDQQWVVESDYLYPPKDSDPKNAIVYPHQDENHPPFRYMGRAIRLDTLITTVDEWLELSDTDPNNSQYLNNLTAVGYGEPSFAAFYPHSYSVFGFYDNAPPDNLEGVKYYVIGKYSEIKNDCLKNIDLNKGSKQPSEKTPEDKLKEAYNWLIDDPDFSEDSTSRTKKLPEKTIFYACLTFGTALLVDSLTANNKKEVDIAVGNTTAEAMSAYVAYKYTKEYKAGISVDSKEFKTYCSKLQDQLEALYLADVFQGRNLDIGFKFKEARHEKEFTAVSGGKFWTIRPISAQSNPTTEDNNSQIQLELPEEFAHLLNELNIRQQDCDRDDDEIESMRKQLVADWYKYMLCAYPPSGDRNDYPDVDEVKYFIRKYDLSPLQARIERNENLKQECKQVWQELKNELDKENAKLRDPQNKNTQKNTEYSLESIPAPRYWLPREPVLLIADSPIVKQTPRHGQDGRLYEDDLLRCQIVQLDQTNNLKEKIDKLNSGINEEKIGFTFWKEQPWHPFLLEWEVEVSSIQGKYQHQDVDTNYPLTRKYDPVIITENYQLAEDGIDLTLKSGREVVKEANIYTGRSILTPHAQIHLKERIDAFLEKKLLHDYFQENVKEEKRTNDYFARHRKTIIDDFLKKKLLEDYYQKNNVPENERTNDYFANNREKIISWHRELQKHPQQAGENSEQVEKIEDYVDKIILKIIEIEEKYGKRIDNNFSVLAQSLGGFNEALLMHKQTLQLPIDDPLGFEDYQLFTNEVREVIKGSNRVAPQPHNDFNPIRTGILTILQLRLVDTFGRIQILKPKDDQIIIADTLTDPARPNDISLPPRLVQPACINFRWLSADDDFIPTEKQSQVEPEMNSHPATTVICGWLLPNNLDSSLMVYDAEGMALGSINQDVQWIPTPGRIPTAVWQISNQHLHKLINYIIQQIQQRPDFLEDFLTTVDNALDNIDPENAAQHQAIALLMGRPIAVVRAKLNLELQGLPAFDQGWNIFRQEVELEAQRTDDESEGNIERETQNFTQVNFPIRIGEYRQLNDGLVGYFIEEKSGYKDNTFYALQGHIKDGGEQNNPRNNIITNDDLNILQSIASPAQTLTMLVDPRGSIHATSGILPTKSIHIPPEQFVDALRKIEITFLTAPILSDRDSINLPLPQAPGYTWSWLAKENGVWDTITKIGAVNDQATFTTQQQIEEGWLKLTQDNQQ